MPTQSSKFRPTPPSDSELPYPSRINRNRSLCFPCNGVGATRGLSGDQVGWTTSSPFFRRRLPEGVPDTRTPLWTTQRRTLGLWQICNCLRHVAKSVAAAFPCYSWGIRSHIHEHAPLTALIPVSPCASESFVSGAYPRHPQISNPTSVRA